MALPLQEFLRRLTATAATGRANAANLAPSGAVAESADQLLSAYLQEAEANVTGYAWQIVPGELAGGRAVLEAEPSLQLAFICASLRRVVAKDDGRCGGCYEDLHRLNPLISQLLRRRLPYQPEDIRQILQLLASTVCPWPGFIPLRGYLRSVARYLQGAELPGDLRGDLERLREAGLRFGGARYAGLSSESCKALELIDELLGESAPPRVEIEAADDWGHAASEALVQLEPAERAVWAELLAYGATADGSKPSKKWLSGAREHVAAVGEARFKERAIAWLGFLRLPSRNTVYVDPNGESLAMRVGQHAFPSAFVAERNGSLLKGLIWCCALFEDDPVARALGDAAEACFKKVPNLGARSTKAGNACIAVLEAMPTLEAVTQLQRLAQRVKYPSAQSLIGTALEKAARRNGLSRDDLDDLAVPTFGLRDGQLQAQFGDERAELVVSGAHAVDLRWFAADGAPRRSEPAGVQRAFPAELKALKQAAEDIRKLLPAQRDRVERLLLSDRSWTLPDWRERYLDHPLLAVLARRLIWSFQNGDRVEAGAWQSGAIVGADDRPLDWLTDTTSVRLWHSIGVDPAGVLAWREWLERHAVTQPFKQAHREVYLLTEAERQTETYSNRFAAHLIRQHQFAALCQQRSWRYRLQGAHFDGANTPTLELPRWGLRAELWIELVEDDALHTGWGVGLYISTDQVRFSPLEGFLPLPLAEVPAVVFSEVMRDVDLFVGVCSIGNDPNWGDRGGHAAHEYWQGYASGELSALAQTRRAVLERLLPHLKIAARCSLTERFLLVRGDLRTYRIHLGSGNVLMEPNSQYLCIVPGRGTDDPTTRGTLFLPFEGDGMLAIILSKAFLLADDRAIKDPSITRQISPT